MLQRSSAGENRSIELGGSQKRFLDGSVDELWIYSRVLSADEIAALASNVFDDAFESGDVASWSATVP